MILFGHAGAADCLCLTTLAVADDSSSHDSAEAFPRRGPVPLLVNPHCGTQDALAVQPVVTS